MSVFAFPRRVRRLAARHPATTDDGNRARTWTTTPEEMPSPRNTSRPAFVDLEERFRPRVGGRGGAIDPERVPTFRRSMLQRLGTLGRGRAGVVTPRNISRIDVRSPRTGSRRCVVKAHFVRMNAAGRTAAALHLTYIERDGVNQDGSKGTIYGPVDDFDRERLVEELPAEKRQFRFIISPEDAGELDLPTFTRALIAQMEVDLGRRLIWGAVDHWDTDNPHVHVVVRGLDAAGKELFIDGKYIGSGLRWRAQEIATRELGLRPDDAIEKQRAREVAQERLTSIDRQLVPLVGPEGRLSLELVGRSGVGLPIVMARLDTLEKLQLATRANVNEWVLAPGWTEALTAMGERNDIIKRLHRAAGHGLQLRILDTNQDVPAFEGVVRRKGLHDELTGELFALVETVSGTAQYVRLPPSVEVREGAIVRVSSGVQPWVRPSDRALQDLAARGGGLYDPAAQRAALEQRPRQPGQPTPAELVEGNERRLTRLAKYRLVERMADGRWRIPPDLVRQLEAREVTHPRRQLRIQEIAPSLREQVRQAGPTWLDRQVAPPAPATRAPFRQEVLAALQERGRVMSSDGIPPRSPAAAIGPLERERLAVAEQVAAAHKLPLAVTIPPRLSGRVVSLDARGERHYVAILDDAGHGLVVLPVSHRSRRLFCGTSATATLGQDGRFVVTPHRSRGDSS